MHPIAEETAHFTGKGFWVAIGIIVACALALYLGGKDKD